MRDAREPGRALTTRLPLLFGATLVVLIVVTAVVCGIALRDVVDQTARTTTAIGDARRAAADLLAAVIDEESALRGYVVARDPLVLAPYRSGLARFPQVDRQLWTDLRAAGVDQCPALLDLEARYAHWTRFFAEPTRREARAGIPRLIAGADDVDAMRTDEARIDARLRAESLRAEDAAREGILRIVVFAALGCGLAVVLIALLVRRELLLTRVAARERDVATRLEAAVRSEVAPIAGFQAAHAYVSSSEGTTVGGDFYDAGMLERGRAYAAVADVSGKGLDAAVDTALVKYTLRAMLVADRDPSGVLSDLNAIYSRRSDDPSRFVTVLLAIVDVDTGLVHYANAGHGTSYVVRSAGRVERLKVGGPPIGVEANESYPLETARLQSGDALVLVTDGVSESRNGAGEPWGEDALFDALGAGPGRPVQALVDDVLARVRERSGSSRDDLALLALRRV